MKKIFAFSLPSNFKRYCGNIVGINDFSFVYVCLCLYSPRSHISSALFVAISLPAILTNFELAERIKFALGQFGAILSVKASRDRKNRPYAFVQFQVPRIPGTLPLLYVHF